MMEGRQTMNRNLIKYAKDGNKYELPIMSKYDVANEIFNKVLDL